MMMEYRLCQRIRRELTEIFLSFLKCEAAALFQLTLIPIAFLVARGMGLLPQRMALVLRSLLLLALLGQYLYTLGVFELLGRMR